MFYTDVGHGTGDSLLLYLSNSSLPPSHLTGLTSLASHTSRAEIRVAKYQGFTHPTQVKLYTGDAVYRGQERHPLQEGSEYDVITALDCAYHFSTRRQFLQQAYSSLTSSGGRIGLADITFSPSSIFSSYFLSFIVPKDNVISTAEYVSQLSEIGFKDVVVEDITSDVFPAFTEFLCNRGPGWGVFGMVMQKLVEAGGMRFVIVTATKK